MYIMLRTSLCVKFTQLKGGNPMREWLKGQRLKQNLTQAQVAEKMGISESYYAFIESGERQKKMDIVVVSKLADILDMSIQEIADLESAPKE